MFQVALVSMTYSLENVLDKEPSAATLTVNQDEEIILGLMGRFQ